MTTDYDSLQLIKGEFRYLTFQLGEQSKKDNIFSLAQELAAYTKTQLLEQNDNEVEHCFKVADEVIQHGSNIAKIAIENIFVFSVRRVLEMSLSVSNEARSLFLKFFKQQYENQITARFP